jgi:hypothetical protein
MKISPVRREAFGGLGADKRQMAKPPPKMAGKNANPYR